MEIRKDQKEKRKVKPSSKMVRDQETIRQGVPRKGGKGKNKSKSKSKKGKGAKGNTAPTWNRNAHPYVKSGKASGKKGKKSGKDFTPKTRRSHTPEKEKVKDAPPEKESQKD